ncbi:MAG: hypothetical protein K6G94_01195, partial [Kiritimatiellae bacterium]|nr:hypothetical protein [Kiritimatiellia bacterium]
MNRNRTITAVAVLAAVISALGAIAAEKPTSMVITIDSSNDLIKDNRETTCGQPLGYAGTMVEYPDEMLQWFFVKDRANTAKAMKAAGAKLVKEWSSVAHWQVGMAYVNAGTDQERESIRKRHHREHFLGDPAKIFSFRKENGMKILLCLEQYNVFTDVASGSKTNDIETVKT